MVTPTLLQTTLTLYVKRTTKLADTLRHRLKRALKEDSRI